MCLLTDGFANTGYLCRYTTTKGRNSRVQPLTRGYQDPHHSGPPISRHPSTGRYPGQRLNMYGISTTRETLGRTYAQNFQVGDLVRIYRPVPPPGMPKKFHPPWSIDAHRVLRVLSPFSLTSPNRSTNQHHRRRSTTTTLNCI